VSERHDHYSYTVYADPATARTFDERRFGGPIGDLIASDQARVLTQFLGPLTAASALDVGTGTGRAALLLAAAGARVTGVDASEAMLEVARRRAVDAHADVTFRVGDAHRLDFPDRSFDAAISLRVIMHTPEWRACVAELCRVARRVVVLDYPSARSAALAQAVGRKALHALGAATEPYRVFLDGQIAAVLSAHGFRVRARHRQFVLPIAIHKTINSAGFTRTVEGVFGRLGLLALLGSPVTLVADRCELS
jgi:ubiquinone/menaquinone biosynthesis C-methylase UbiE